MSKHSLISTAAGLGLMAASMGASAQMHTFDYSMMYFGSAATGGKYVAFVPSMTRDSVATNGSSGVLMLELFQPASGSASTWAYAIGGPVDSVAGAGVVSDSGVGLPQTVAWTANNGLAMSQNFYFGNNESIKLGFAQAAVATGTPALNCNVSFTAEIGTNDQLFFKNVAVKPDITAWASAAAEVSVYSHSSLTSPTYKIAQTDWEKMSATTPLIAGASAKVVGVGAAGTDSVIGTDAGALISARNRCVPAYTNRATGGGVTPIVGSGIGFVRIW